MSSADLDGYLTTHLMDPALLRADDFQAFLRDRARRLLDAIEAKTRRPIQGRESEQVLKDFGGPLTKQEAQPPAVQATLYGRYDVLEELGGGAMAQAFRVRDLKSGQVVFLKRAKLDGSIQGDAIQREVAIYDKLRRHGLHGVLEVLDIETGGGALAIITEYADGGTLGEFVTSSVGGILDGTATKAIAKEILAAIHELHGAGIVHRDLKPANILRHNGGWKIADFGIAKNLGRLMTNRTFQQTGSPGFAPPEQTAGAEARPSADIYHFGKLITYMLTGSTDPDVITMPEWSEIVHGCTRKQEDERLGLDAVAGLLERILA